MLTLAAASAEGWVRVYAPARGVLESYGIEVATLPDGAGGLVCVAPGWAVRLWERGPQLASWEEDQGPRPHPEEGEGPRCLWQNLLRRVVLRGRELPRAEAEELAEAALCAAALGGPGAVRAVLVLARGE